MLPQIHQLLKRNALLSAIYYENISKTPFAP
jgi:hypothetical protein